MANTMKNNEKLFRSSLLGEEYSLIRHESGLDIYIYPKKTTTAFALLATHYGSVDNSFKAEGDDKVTVLPMGIAHFLEHKMFTKEDGTDAFDRFSELGADANAYTSYDKTVYLFSCTSNFNECLRELIDFVTHPFFTKESVAKEQGIIAEEIRMYDDSPQNRSYYGMLTGLYNSHDVKNNICGTVQSISEITPELLYKCHRVFYDLSNMALVICGDVDKDAVIKIADELLPPCQGQRFERKKQDTEGKAAFPFVKAKMQLAKPIFDIGIKDTAVPAEPHLRERRNVAMSIVTDLLFSQTGELYGELYEAGLISPGFGGTYTISEDFGFCAVSGESGDPELVYSKVKEYMLKKRKEGFSDEDFERCRKVFYSSFVRGLDSADDISGDLISFVFDGYDFFGYADIISSITLHEVMEIYRSSFDSECFTLSAVFPIDYKQEV